MGFLKRIIVQAGAMSMVYAIYTYYFKPYWESQLTSLGLNNGLLEQSAGFFVLLIPTYVFLGAYMWRMKRSERK